MVEATQHSEKKNVLVLGALGAGKSTIMSILHYEDHKQGGFKSSNSLEGVT
jgi:ABC-type molybdenum transport system ATPase subunit/photorepair protein PhrA